MFKIGDRVRVISLSKPAAIVSFPYGGTHANVRVEGDSIDRIASLNDLEAIVNASITYLSRAGYEVKLELLENTGLWQATVACDTGDIYATSRSVIALTCAFSPVSRDIDRVYQFTKAHG